MVVQTWCVYNRIDLISRTFYQLTLFIRIERATNKTETSHTVAGKYVLNFDVITREVKLAMNILSN